MQGGVATDFINWRNGYDNPTFHCWPRTPLDGKSALDVGCGAGLLAEPLARLGAAVTGLDASPELIAAARSHAAATGLPIDYHSGDLQEMEGQFDLVTCMEVIEHVADPAAFVCALAKRLAPGGLLVLSTPNATAWVLSSNLERTFCASCRWATTSMPPAVPGSPNPVTDDSLRRAAFRRTCRQWFTDTRKIHRIALSLVSSLLTLSSSRRKTSWVASPPASRSPKIRRQRRWITGAYSR